jgi:hypothetical protein
MKRYPSPGIERKSIMEAVEVYYNGSSFVPRRPVSVRKNQRAFVTILDEVVEPTPERKAFSLRGMFADGKLSSERFAAAKQFEKELEK